MTSAAFNADIGRQQFLNLFVTQLQHQDPMEPVGQQEFLQQLAQFSTVEGLENLNDKFDKLIDLQKNADDISTLQALNSGASLLGKTVRHGTDVNDVGIVSEVRKNEGQILIQVGGQLIPISDVQSVSTTPIGNVA
ncbi:MAG: hypothetical protein JNL58_08380 [Planctomyces sp.]|nr:hypothetical protein [Planctomyces sp.]